MKFISTLILNVLLVNVYAQEDFPELIGDRPDQTESAFVIPKGYIQFEDGFVYENETSEVQNISYSSMLLRYGLFDNFELRVATSYDKTKETGLDDISGFTPISVGAKIHVQEEQGWIPQIAFLGHIGIEETGNSDFKQQYHSAQMVLTFNHTLNEAWSLGYSLGVTFPSETDYAIGTYTLVSGLAITEKLGGFIEIYGDFSKYLYPENKVNGGITYLVSHILQIDFAGGYGLSEAAADNYFGAGLIYLFKVR